MAQQPGRTPSEASIFGVSEHLQAVIRLNHWVLSVLPSFASLLENHPIGVDTVKGSEAIARYAIFSSWTTWLRYQDLVTFFPSNFRSGTYAEVTQGKTGFSAHVYAPDSLETYEGIDRDHITYWKNVSYQQLRLRYHEVTERVGIPMLIGSRNATHIFRYLNFTHGVSVGVPEKRLTARLGHVDSKWNSSYYVEQLAAIKPPA